MCSCDEDSLYALRAAQFLSVAKKRPFLHHLNWKHPFQGLAQSLSERLETPVEIADPLNRVNLARGADHEFVQQNASSLAVTIGLAARRPGDKT